MPQPWSKVDSGYPACVKIDPPDNSAFVVEQEDGGSALQDQKRLAFRRIQMAMRLNIGPAQHDVQKAMRVVARAGMEVVVHTPAGRRGRPFSDLIEEFAVDELYHC